MADVEVRDVLLRVGGRTLHRTGFLAAMGAGRGYVEVKETFTRADATTCATFVDRDVGAGQILRLAEAGKVRIEYPPALSGLVDQFGYPYCGPSLEGTRQNIVENGDAEADVVGITGANGGETIVRDATHSLKSGGFAAKVTTQNLGGSGHWYRKRDTTRLPAAAATTYTFSVDIFAESDAVGKAMIWVINWWNSVPAIISASTSSAFTLVAGWQRLAFTATSPAATVTCQPIFETNGALGIFNYWADLAQFELGAFMSSRIPTNTGAVIRAADSLTLPFNFGPMDLTVLARMARPLHADAVGALGPSRLTAMQLGAQVGNHIELFANGAARQWTSRFSDGVTFSQDAAATILAGNEQKFIGQYQTMKTNPLNAVDVGGGLTAFTDGSVAGFSSYGSQTLRIGGTDNAGQEIYGVLLDLVIMRGLRTLNEALALP